VERLVRSVPQMLAEHGPLDAFRVWFRTLADFVQLKRGLGEALQSPLLMMSFMTRLEPSPAALTRADRAMELAIDGLRRH
jgi:hypothetical protein